MLNLLNFDWLDSLTISHQKTSQLNMYTIIQKCQILPNLGKYTIYLQNNVKMPVDPTTFEIWLAPQPLNNGITQYYVTKLSWDQSEDITGLHCCQTFNYCYILFSILDFYYIFLGENELFYNVNFSAISHMLKMWRKRWKCDITHATYTWKYMTFDMSYDACDFLCDWAWIFRDNPSELWITWTCVDEHCGFTPGLWIECRLYLHNLW